MLSGIVVLDLSRVLAGPCCTMTLADLGAEVIKVESPKGGDETRKWGPPFHKGESAYYLSCNRNKKSITVDFTTEEGKALVQSLAEKADVLVENFKVDGLKKYGLDYDSIQKINKSIIYCSITGYGQDSPYRDQPGYDFIIQGLSGLMSITGNVEGPPMKVGVAITDVLAGSSAATSILAALYRRSQTGQGEHIDISLLDNTVASLVNVASNYLVSQKETERFGNAHPNIVPYETFKAKDGYLNIAVGNNRQFANLCEAFEHPELAEDERYRNNADRVKNRKLLIPRLNEITVQKTIEDWVDILQVYKVPVGAIKSVSEALEDIHMLEREMVTPVPHPLGGAVNLVASPLKFKHYQTQIKSPPPTLGEHTNEVLTTFLNLTPQQLEALKEKHVI